MRILRRTILRGAVVVAVLPNVSPIAKAQNYPARPVKIIVPFGAGGPTDVYVRAVAVELQKGASPEFRDLKIVLALARRSARASWPTRRRTVTHC